MKGVRLSIIVTLKVPSTFNHADKHNELHIRRTAI